MITLKLNDKPVQIPTSWEEVTYIQFIGILTVKNSTFDLLEIFTGIPVEQLKKMVIIGVEHLLNSLSFINKPPVMPGFVTKCGPYQIPDNGKFNIQFESLGQFEDMRAIFKTLDDTPIGMTKSYGKYVAIYLQKIRDKEYDSLKVPELEAEIQNYPALEVITLGSFFFLKLMSLSAGTPLTCPTTSPKQQKQSLKSSGKSSGSMRKSTGSRGR